MSFFKKIFCCSCKCFKKTKYEDEITKETLLLPKNPSSKQKNIVENKLIVYGTCCPGFSNTSLNLLEYSSSTVKKIVSGENHVLILFSDGKLYGIGSNTNGQLGLKLDINGGCLMKLTLINLNFESYNDYKSLKYDVIDIAAGDLFSLVLIKFSGITNPILVRLSINDRDKYSDTFNNIPTLRIENISHTLNISSIYSLGSRSLLLSFSNEIYIGGKDFNMFPIEDYKLFYTSQVKINKVAIGSEHCLILDEKGLVYTAGDNTYGETGLETKYSENLTRLSFFNELSIKIKTISCGIRNSFVLLNDGSLYVFGDNSDGQSTGYDTRYLQPGLVPYELEKGEVISEIFTGYNHSFIKGSKGNVYSWGSCEEGKLGYKDSRNFVEFPKIVQGLSQKEINYIYAGKRGTVISVLSQSLK